MCVQPSTSGACCLEDNSCKDLPFNHCSSNGWRFLGSQCSAVGHLCAMMPPVQGVCCWAGDKCTQAYSKGDCPYKYLEGVHSCLPNPCVTKQDSGVMPPRDAGQGADSGIKDLQSPLDKGTCAPPPHDKCAKAKGLVGVPPISEAVPDTCCGTNDLVTDLPTKGPDLFWQADLGTGKFKISFSPAGGWKPVVRMAYAGASGCTGAFDEGVGSVTVDNKSGQTMILSVDGADFTPGSGCGKGTLKVEKIP